MPKAQAISTFLSLWVQGWGLGQESDTGNRTGMTWPFLSRKIRNAGKQVLMTSLEKWAGSPGKKFLPTRDQGGERRAHLSSWPGVIPFKNIPSCCNPGLGSFWTPMNLEIVPETLARNQEYPSRLPSTSHARTSDEWNLICM